MILWTVTTSTDSVFTDLISNSRWTSFKFVHYQTIRMLWYNQSIVLSRANVLVYQECLRVQTKTSYSYMILSYSIYRVKHVCNTWSTHVLHVFDKEVKI